MSGIDYLAQQKAYSLVRVNSTTLRFYTNDGHELLLSEKITLLTHTHQVGEWTVALKNEHGAFIQGRLCAIRKSEAAAERTIKKILRVASKKQKVVKPITLEYAKFVIIFTTLPIEKFNAEKILDWYRLRWQIELAFKRLKSLVCLGHLPKHDERSARAWLYGKLFVGLLVEKLMSYAGSLSPCGLCL